MTAGKIFAKKSMEEEKDGLRGGNYMCKCNNPHADYRSYAENQTPSLAMQRPCTSRIPSSLEHVVCFNQMLPVYLV